MKYKITMFITSLIGVASYFMPFFAFGSSFSHFESCSFSGLNALIETKKIQWGNFLENGISVSLIKILGIIYACVFVAACIVSFIKNKKAVLSCFGLVNIILLICIMSLMLNIPKLGTIAHPFLGFIIGAICSFLLLINFIFSLFMNKKKKDDKEVVEEVKVENNTENTVEVKEENNTAGID